MGFKNFFKKLSHGTSNVFKKIEHGGNNFFKKLPAQVNHVVDQAGHGINKGLGEVGTVARKVGNSLEKYASPIVNGLAVAGSIVAPEFAPAIMAGNMMAQRGLTSATSLSHAIQSGARSGQSMTNQLAHQVKNKSNQVIGQAQQGFRGGMSNLQSHANNTLMQGRTAVNQAVNQGRTAVSHAVQGVDPLLFH